jgi:uncharacterized protein (DUF1330 family)
VEQYGGRYLVRGGKTVAVSGNWNPERLLVIEFESLTDLQNCFSSQAYKLVAHLRIESTRSRSLIAEGTGDSFHPTLNHHSETGTDDEK